MKINKYRFGYNYKKEYKIVAKVRGYEGTVIYRAENSNKHYIIEDSGTLADFLDLEKDKRLINELIKIIEFEDELECENYIKANYA